jgi:hypothetical protein
MACAWRCTPMKTEPTPLAARRAALVAQCAQQRVDLAHDLHALRTPLGGGVRAWLGAHKTTLLGAGGVVLGLVATRPRRLLSLAATGLSVYKIARNLLPLLSRRDVNRSIT